MKRAFEVIILVVYLAVVFTMVRPGSQGPSLIKALGDGLSGIITAAVGGGSWGPVQSGGSGTSGTVYA